MATIDLKQAKLYIRDGYSNAGAVNNSGTYAIGVATMLVDAITGAIPTGTVFTIAGQLTEYEVTAHSETSTNTTSVTFTPALVAAAADNAVITFHAHEIEVRIGEGNLSWTEKVTRQYKKNNGLLDTVRNGDEEQVEVTFDFVLDHIIGSSSDPITISEALKRNGNADYWVSSSDDPCEPYSVDLVVLYTPECEDVEVEQILFDDFRYESLDHNIKDGTVACKGAANVTMPTVTRI